MDVVVFSVAPDGATEEMKKYVAPDGAAVRLEK